MNTSFKVLNQTFRKESNGRFDISKYETMTSYLEQTSSGGLNLLTTHFASFNHVIALSVLNFTLRATYFIYFYLTVPFTPVVLNLGATAPYGALLTFRGAEIFRGAL